LINQALTKVNNPKGKAMRTLLTLIAAVAILTSGYGYQYQNPNNYYGSPQHHNDMEMQRQHRNMQPKYEYNPNKYGWQNPGRKLNPGQNLDPYNHRGY
jgi:hypothetical protein